MAYEVSLIEEGGKKYAEVDDSGKVIFVDTDVAEDDPKRKTPIDVVSTYTSIPKLRAEAAERRKEAEELRKKVDVFGEIDPAKAIEALKIVQNLKDGDLVKANEVEVLKKSIENSYVEEKKSILEVHATQLSAKETEINTLNSTVRKLLISNQFKSSAFFSGATPKCTIPAEIAESYFGQNFKVENVGGVPNCVAYIMNPITGVEEKIYSRSNPGVLADFDEAMAIILDKYPGKEAILSAGKTGVGGGGGTFVPGTSGNGTVIKVTRDQVKNPAFYRQMKENEAKGQVYEVIN